jgi:hypothetical protein
MFLYIPVGNFANDPSSYVVLYSQFGLLPNLTDRYEANDGFEEWSTLTPVIPEPTTVIAGALLLLPFAASTLRMVRKNRAV